MGGLTNALLIGLLLTLSTFQSLLCRKYSEHYPGEESMSSPVFSIISGIVVALITFAFAGFSFSASWLTLLLGGCNAVALFLYNTCMIKASQSGPYSVLMTFMLAGGIIVPAVINYFAFQTPLSIVQILSILVIFGAIYIVSYKEGEGKGSLGFYIACLGLFLFNGVYGALLNVQQELTTVAEKEEMIILTYLGSLTISAIVLLVTRGRRFVCALRQTRKSLFFLLSCTVVISLAMNLLVFIIPLINTTVLFTFDNAGVLLISVLISHFFFKERLSRLNWIGCVIMCLALICVSVFSVDFIGTHFH
jgi:drug/metabolite transporter (DMT)-like permease